MVETFHEYTVRVCQFISNYMFLSHQIDQHNNVCFTYQPLSWNIYINHALFYELYDHCASVESAYYHIRRRILDNFIKVLFKDESKM